MRIKVSAFRLDREKQTNYRYNEKNCLIHFENVNNFLFFMLIHRPDNKFTDELQPHRYHTCYIVIFFEVFYQCTSIMLCYTY